ncbi:MBL fold metallo-hydrolase [Actinomycetospora straminea]|uniref:Metallo-beta-lactamase domain-containing protein n=1 Tax=Actinomycetospora straminea TaxID=663607 RepID=A0ABP9EZX2_9PSEU|nr:MBL fold metallo-hydrolase [Actinomycetospora straminea]MDD7935795.1 MBL fold metallo-hydrolase [Actinomycetospora straminea]
MALRLREVADGVHLGALVPGGLLHTVLIEGPEGDVVVDAGFPWSARRLVTLLRGRDVALHAVTHAHGDHVGSSAWLCRQTGAPLAMGEADAGRFEDGRLDTHSGAFGRLVLAPLARERRPVDRRLREGDRVGGFEVLAVPGHSPGTLALWRAGDRVLVVGDGPVNVSTDPRSPRWLPLPRGLHDDPAAAAASRGRLAELRPALVVAMHGHPVADPDAWAAAAP